MARTTHTPALPSTSTSEGTYFKAQLQRVYEFLLTRTATISEVEKETGICRPNLCRIKRELELSGRLAVVKIDRCPVTRDPDVQHVTCNRALFPKVSPQLSLPFASC